MDAKDPRVGPTDGESVMDVAVRLQGFIKRTESQSKGYVFHSLSLKGLIDCHLDLNFISVSIFLFQVTFLSLWVQTPLITASCKRKT
jgi:broad specificity phosphatase PhoE